jgi:hypothetical protein
VRTRYEIAIEILDAAFPASSWQGAYGDVVTNAAMSWGGLDWDWEEHPWGLLLKVAFPSEAEYEQWRTMPAIVAALDAVPDPVNGLIFHRGWGGTSGSGEPRRGRPLAGAGGAEVPLPEDADDSVIAVAPGAVRDMLERTRVRTAVA